MTTPTSNLHHWKNHGVQCLNSNCPELEYSVSAGDTTLEHVHPKNLYTKFLYTIDDKAVFLAIWREKFANSGTCLNEHSKNPTESEAGLFDLSFSKMVEIPAKYLNEKDINEKIYKGIMPHISQWSELRRISACIFCLDNPLQVDISTYFPPIESYTPSSSMIRVQRDHN